MLIEGPGATAVLTYAVTASSQNRRHVSGLVLRFSPLICDLCDLYHNHKHVLLNTNTIISFLYHINCTLMK